jgi:methionine aminopeptidase
MRKAGRLVAECLDMLLPEIRSGVTTEHIDRLVFEFAVDYGAMPATLMYRLCQRHSTARQLDSIPDPIRYPIPLGQDAIDLASTPRRY